MASAGSTLGTKKDSPDDQHHFLDTKQFAGVEGNKGELKRPEPGSYRPPSRLGTFSARRGLSADAVPQPPSSRVLEWLQACSPSLEPPSSCNLGCSPHERGASIKATGVPFEIWSATRSASQFVSRTQPCDAALDTFPGEGVPWMP